MKIRKGFVSNSSSSSFIVMFPEKPKSAEHVKKMMFKKDKDIYDQQLPAGLSLDTIAENVYIDIKEQKPNDIRKILDELQEEETMHVDLSEFRTEDGYDYEAIGKYIKKQVDDIIKGVFKGLKKKDDVGYIYTFRYSDEEGGHQGFMEHGGIFDELECITESNH